MDRDLGRGPERDARLAGAAAREAAGARAAGAMAAVDEPRAGLGGDQPRPGEDARGMAAEADEQHAHGPLARDVREQVVIRRERRERRLAGHRGPVAPRPGDDAARVVDRRAGEAAVRLGPAVEPAAEALRRELVALLPAQAETTVS